MRRIEAFWRRRGLRWGAAVAALLGGSLLVMFALVYWRTSVLLFDTLDRSVTEQLSLLAARPPEMLAFMIASRMNHAPAVVTQVGLFDTYRRPIVGDIGEVPDRLVLDGRVHPVLAPDDPAVHWRAAGRILPDGRVLIVARAADDILDVRAGLMRGAAAGIIPAILLSLAGGALVSRTSERRLRQLNAIAERIIAGELARRLPARADGDELDRLCMIVNRMLARLEAGVEALQAVGENIAHDLRTPLTALRVRLERSAELTDPATEAGASVVKAIQDIDQALAIVTALLRIADIQHVRREAAFVRFDLAALVREAAEAYQPVADERGVALTCDIATGATILADRQLLAEAVINLLDNAVKFTPGGGQVRIALAGSPGRPVVTISDSGPGIPAGSRAAVFQRFHRGEASRSSQGHGLGLSLVAAVAALHRFEIELGDNAPGCRVTLRCWRTEATRPAC